MGDFFNFTDCMDCNCNCNWWRGDDYADDNDYNDSDECNQYAGRGCDPLIKECVHPAIGGQNGIHIGRDDDDGDDKWQVWWKLQFWHNGMHIGCGWWCWWNLLTKKSWTLNGDSTGVLWILVLSEFSSRLMFICTYMYMDFLLSPFCLQFHSS